MKWKPFSILRQFVIPGGVLICSTMVCKGNYSRNGIACIIFNKEGDPVGVESLGIALAPGEPNRFNVYY
jgi:hypothetical protein